MGTDFINYYGGIVKMGDTPSLLYMMHGDASHPEGESWGGSFERMTFSPRTIYYHGTNKPCEIAPYSVLELRFKGKNLPKENIYKPAFTITIDKQNWEGVYIGNREYSVRYSPKAPTTLDYLTHSDMPELDGLTGKFTVSDVWPGKQTAKSWKLGCNWYTDKADKSLFDGKWQGAQTILKWRNELLEDWAKRWSWLYE